MFKRIITATGLTLALALAAGTSAASADMNSGAGAVGSTHTVCQNAMYTHHTMEVSADVGQDFDGQWVAVQFWVYDARGWTPTGWAMSNNPGWNPFGVNFHLTDYPVQPAYGYAAWVYVQYAWYDANGWRVGGEMVTDYTTQSGTHDPYCRV